jgi:hypothetical protein
MTTQPRKVRNVTWRRSTYSGQYFEVGTCRRKGKTVTVWRTCGEWWTASPDQFNQPIAAKSP